MESRGWDWSAVCDHWSEFYQGRSKFARFLIWLIPLALLVQMCEVVG